MWNEIEKISNVKLLNKNGCLILAPEKESNEILGEKIRCAKEYNISHQLLDCNEIHTKFPEFSNIKNINGFYELDAGFAYPELIIKTQLQIARDNGATLNYDTTITSLKEEKGIVTITTGTGDTITANKVLVAAGPWINELIPKEISVYHKVYRQVLYWFDSVNKEYFNSNRFPVFIFNLRGDIKREFDNLIYGFPSLSNGAGIKLATENFVLETNQDTINRSVTKEEIATFYSDYLQENFDNVISKKCLKTATCLYTVTPDRDFIVDFITDAKKVLFISACSGHGFKHSAAMGELGIQTLIEAPTLLNPNVFSYKRFT